MPRRVVARTMVAIEPPAEADPCTLVDGPDLNEQFEGIAMPARDVAWIVEHDSYVPPGRTVVPTCGNPLCIDPEHLVLSDAEPTECVVARLPQPQPIREMKLGRRAGWALANGPTKGKKRLKVLIVIGAYLDNGISDPSIREIAARTGIAQPYVVDIVERLATEGYIAIARGTPHVSSGEAQKRNTYSLPCN